MRSFVHTYKFPFVENLIRHFHYQKGDNGNLITAFIYWVSLSNITDNCAVFSIIDDAIELLFANKQNYARYGCKAIAMLNITWIINPYLMEYGNPMNITIVVDE